MRAVVCRELGPIEGLELDHVKAPDCGAGQVRIAIKAAGVNFADQLLVAGKYQDKAAPPFTPGFEIAGIVQEIGEGVTTCRVGDRVMAMLDHGGFAEQAVARQAEVLVLPDTMDFADAAGFPVAYGTAHHGLVHKGALRPGEVLLVHGAAGGAGLTAVEVGAALGATVIATAGGPEKVQVALDHGASFGIDYKTEDVRARVKDITAERGADVVYDPVGGAMWEASMRCTAPGGRLMAIGFASGQVPQIPANILLVKNLTVVGYWWGAYRRLDPSSVRQSLLECLELYRQGRIKPHVSRRFPLDQAVEAIKALKAPGTTGKIVLTVESA